MAHKTRLVHAKTLSDSGINLKKINVTDYDGLKIYRALAKCGSAVHSMKLHDDLNCFELCYCLSGSIEIRVRDKTHRLSDNEVILFDGALDHDYTAASETEYLVMHLSKEPARLESLLESAVT